MLYPPVADMLKNVDSRYLLVNVVAQRARVISEEAEAFGEELTDKEYSDIKGEMRKQEILHSLVERKELLMDINM